MIKQILAVILAGALAGCVAAPGGRPVESAQRPAPAPSQALRGAEPSRDQVSEFLTAVARIEPTASGMCRAASPDRPARQCAFDYRLIDAPRLGPNAFQTVGRDGRPIVAMTAQLVAQTENADEIAFILGHESAHHIADHIARTRSQALTGALVLGALATLNNASDDVVSQMMDLGADLGGRAYSQDFELEADRLGAYIAARAGYDPARGALIFARPVLAGGGGVLSTHPASAQRAAAAAATAAEIRRQQLDGRLPDRRPTAFAPLSNAS